MATERAIKYAIDKNTGEIIDADELYDDRLIGFETRKKYNRLFNLNINTDYNYYLSDTEVKILLNKFVIN